MNKNEFGNKHVLVTGCAGGIGSACARHFPGRRPTVTLVDVDEHGLQTTRAALGIPERTRTQISFLTNAQEFVLAVQADDAPLYALMHTADLFEQDPLDAKDRSVWDRSIASNLTTAYESVLVFRGGCETNDLIRVVLCTSRAFQRGTPGRAAYAAAKGAIVELVRSFSRDLAPKTLVNAVSAGLIRTRMTSNLVEAMRPQRLAEIPLGRSGETEDVASVVGFQCSAETSTAPGQVITVDGSVING